MSSRVKVPAQLSGLLASVATSNQRGFVVVVGDAAFKLVPSIHFLLSKQTSANPSVTWCYAKSLPFSLKKNTHSLPADSPLALFLSSSKINYCYYKESTRLLGTTTDLLVLQDFHAITPNILAQTVETVAGGGLVLLLLSSLDSLKQLYSLAMDVHSRYRSASADDPVARFNERFILSLSSSKNTLFMDENYNILPITLANPHAPIHKNTPLDTSLTSLKDSLKDSSPLNLLISTSKTLDQANALLAFIDAIAEKSLNQTITLTAPRGRGKSATLGIAVAAAVAYGYSNIFITSPSPENLKTLFQFIFVAFDSINYQEHLDYDIIQSNNPQFNNAIVRVNIFKNHRQTIQYINPNDHLSLAQAELLVIDEAAAIPLPIIKNLLGPYLVFLASTINGYEGTGRSLSIKLLQQLRQQSIHPSQKSSSRSLKEITLNQPIRYAQNDPIESWLNNLLCLNPCSQSISKLTSSGCPHPSSCNLFYVNRDSLFSYHPVSESFLQKLMSIYVASHYKNSPNDLQLLSDAPAHHLFVLLPPIASSSQKIALPDPLCVIQVCFEGNIARGSALASLARGIRAAGDLIPWVVAQQFQDDDFASLSGARIVRIATHPDYIGMGYGARAIQQLEAYFRGDFSNLSESIPPQHFAQVSDHEIESFASKSIHSKSSLLTERISIRDPSTMPPLLLKLSERPLHHQLHWLGVSFGITDPLFRFWKRLGYRPVYLRQTPNDITGEHTCIVLKPLASPTISSSSSTIKIGSSTWLNDFTTDFRHRFIPLLSYQFKQFPSSLCLSILESTGSISASHKHSSIVSPSTQSPMSSPITSPKDVYRYYSPHDLKRLESYSNNLLDYHVIMDMIPRLSHHYFMDMFSPNNPSSSISSLASHIPKLSTIQSLILLSTGLQHNTLDDTSTHINISVSQTMALFGKLVKKMYGYMQHVIELDVERDVSNQLEIGMNMNQDKGDGKKRLGDLENGEWDPMQQSLNDAMKPVMKSSLNIQSDNKSDDNNEEENDDDNPYKQHQKDMINTLNLSNYAIPSSHSFTSSRITPTGSNIISIKSTTSSKKRKQGNETGESVSDGLLKMSTGKDGIIDPNNVIGKLKQRKLKQKSNRDKKKMIH